MIVRTIATLSDSLSQEDAFSPRARAQTLQADLCFFFGIKVGWQITNNLLTYQLTNLFDSILEHRVDWGIHIEEIQALKNGLLGIT